MKKSLLWIYAVLFIFTSCELLVTDVSGFLSNNLIADSGQNKTPSDTTSPDDPITPPIPIHEILDFILGSDDTYTVKGTSYTTGIVTIPEMYEGKVVVGIENGAFEFNTSITSLVLPQTIVSVGDNAFSGCSNLKTVALQEGVETIGSNAFSSCSSLETIVFPESLKIIKEEAFANCTSLNSAYIGNNVSLIENGAFMNCRQLTEIVIPLGLETIESNAFLNCNSLTVFLESTFEGTNWVDNWDSGTVEVVKGIHTNWHELTFDSEGGGYIPPVPIKTGSSLASFPVPYLEGKNFLGWSLSSEGSIFDFSKKITESNTFYAIWE